MDVSNVMSRVSVMEHQRKDGRAAVTGDANVVSRGTGGGKVGERAESRHQSLEGLPPAEEYEDREGAAMEADIFPDSLPVLRKHRRHSEPSLGRGLAGVQRQQSHGRSEGLGRERMPFRTAMLHSQKAPGSGRGEQESAPKRQLSEAMSAYRQLFGSLRHLPLSQLIRRLESPEEWLIGVPHEVLDRLGCQMPEKLAAGVSGGEGGARRSHGLIALKAPGRMLQFYSLFQQLFLEIFLCSRLVTQGVCDWELDRGFQDAALEHVLDFVPLSSPLGTLASQGVTEAVAQLKRVLARSISSVCPREISHLQRASEIVARVLTLVRQDLICSTGDQDLEDGLEPDETARVILTPAGIPESVRRLVAADIDRLVWLVDIGQVSCPEGPETLQGMKLAELLLRPLLQGVSVGGVAAVKRVSPSTLPNPGRSSWSKISMEEIFGRTSGEYKDGLYSGKRPATETAVADTATSVTSTALVVHGYSSDSPLSSTDSHRPASGSDSPRSVLMPSSVNRKAAQSISLAAVAAQTQESIEDLALRYNTLALEVASMKLQLGGAAASASGSSDSPKGSEKGQYYAASDGRGNGVHGQGKMHRERLGRSTVGKQRREEPLGSNQKLPPQGWSQGGESLRRQHSVNVDLRQVTSIQTMASMQQDYKRLTRDLDGTRSTLALVEVQCEEIEKEQQKRSRGIRSLTDERVLRQQLLKLREEKEGLMRQNVKLARDLQLLQEAMVRFHQGQSSSSGSASDSPSF